MAFHSIHQAIVVATPTATIRGRLRPLAQVRVGGISLIKRTLLNLAKEGIRRFVVVIADEAVRETAARDGQLASLDIHWVLNADRADEDGYSVLRAGAHVRGDYLVVPCDRVFDAQIVRQLLQESSRGLTLAVAGSEERRHSDGGLVRVGEYGRRLARADASAGFTGLLTANRDLMRALEAFEAERMPLALDRALAQLPPGEIRELDVGTAFWQPIAEATGRARAEKHLITSLRKSVDGVVARYVNRVFSLAVTNLLKNTPVRPNHVTAFSLGISILAAITAAQATAANAWWLLVGAGLWQLASMLDGVDGELARLKFAGSKAGEWFDTLTDDIGKFVFFIGSGVGAAATFGNSIWFNILALAVTIQIGMSLAIYRKLLQTGSGSHYALTWDDTPEAKPLWTRLITRIEFLSRRDSYVALWLILTAVGLIKVSIVLTLTITICVLVSELVSPRQARSGFIETRPPRNSLPPS